MQVVLQRFAVGDAHAGVRRECLMALLTMHRRGLALEASCYAAAEQALDDHNEEVRAPPGVIPWNHRRRAPHDRSLQYGMQALALWCTSTGANSWRPMPVGGACHRIC